MSTKTNFIFSVSGIGLLKIRQRKFHEQEYQVKGSHEIVYSGLTSWSQPCTFQLYSPNNILIQDIIYEIKDVKSSRYLLIDQIVNEEKIVTPQHKLIPFYLDNCTALIRISPGLIFKNPL